jgi:hypothetical protein
VVHPKSLASTEASWLEVPSETVTQLPQALFIGCLLKVLPLISFPPLAWLALAFNISQDLSQNRLPTFLFRSKLGGMGRSAKR